MNEVLINLFFFSLFIFSARAVDFKGSFYQGNLIIGKTDPGSQIS